FDHPKPVSRINCKTDRADNLRFGSSKCNLESSRRSHRRCCLQPSETGILDGIQRRKDNDIIFTQLIWEIGSGRVKAKVVKIDVSPLVIGDIRDLRYPGLVVDNPDEDFFAQKWGYICHHRLQSSSPLSGG